MICTELRAKQVREYLYGRLGEQSVAVGTVNDHWLCIHLLDIMVGNEMAHLHYYSMDGWKFDEYSCHNFHTDVREPFRTIIEECLQSVELCAKLEGE